MAKVRDRTEDLKDAARRVAMDLDYNESKTAAIMASFIMHKRQERTPFTKAALRTLESIGALEQFLVTHKKDYVDLHRTTEQERDSIEHEVTVFVKACQEQIDVLKDSIPLKEANTKRGWLGIQNENMNADTIAHKRGVVLILSEKLHAVTSQFDKLRALRFQDAINRVAPKRKVKRTKTNDISENSSSSMISNNEDNSNVRHSDENQSRLLMSQQQLLDDDTRALQLELSSMLDAVQETESRMVEMSALNHLMSTHVLQQSQQIEVLYTQAVEATKNVEDGNKELDEVIDKNSSCTTFLVLFFAVLIFSVIFLDWYSS